MYCYHAQNLLNDNSLVEKYAWLSSSNGSSLTENSVIHAIAICDYTLVKWDWQEFMSSSTGYSCEM